MDAHAGATSVALMRIAARILGSADNGGDLIPEAGIAYGLAGMLRNLPVLAARGKLYVPLDLLAEESVGAAEALSPKRAPALKSVIDRVAAHASARLARVRQMSIARDVLAAILPAALVPDYLSRLAKASDPLRQLTDMSQLRRQVILLSAALRKRL